MLTRENQMLRHRIRDLGEYLRVNSLEMTQYAREQIADGEV
jgi:hypothetical protein